MKDYSSVFEKMSPEQTALFVKSVDRVGAKNKSSTEIMDDLNNQLRIMDENIKTGKPLTHGVKSYDATMINDPLSFYRLVYSVLIIVTNLMSGVSKGIYNSKFAKQEAEPTETTGGGRKYYGGSSTETGSSPLPEAVPTPPVATNPVATNPDATNPVATNPDATIPVATIVSKSVETVVKRSVQVMDQMTSFLLNKIIDADTDWNQLTPKTNLWLVKLAAQVELMTQNPGVKQALADLAEAYTTLAIDVVDATEPSIEKINNKALDTIHKVGSRSIRGLASTGQALIMEGISLIPVAGPILDFVFGFFIGMGNLLLAITPGMKAGLEGAGDGITLLKTGRDVVNKNKAPVEKAYAHFKSLTAGNVAEDPHTIGVTAAKALNTAEVTDEERQEATAEFKAAADDALKNTPSDATPVQLGQAGETTARNFFSSMTDQAKAKAKAHADKFGDIAGQGLAQAKSYTDIISDRANQAKALAKEHTDKISDMASQAQTTGLAGIKGKFGDMASQAQTHARTIAEQAQTHARTIGEQAQRTMGSGVPATSAGGGKNAKKIRRTTKKISNRLQKSIRRFRGGAGRTGRGGRISRKGRLSKRR